MKRTIGLSLVLMVGCITGAAVRDIIVPVRAQGQSGPNYEYDVVADYNTLNAKEICSRYGRQGWRLVQVTNVGLFFERQLPR